MVVPSSDLADPPFLPINLLPFSLISNSVTSKLNTSFEKDIFEKKNVKTKQNIKNLILFFIYFKIVN